MAEKKWKQVKALFLKKKTKKSQTESSDYNFKRKKESRKSDDLNNIKLHFFRPRYKVKLYHIKFYVFFYFFFLLVSEVCQWFKLH